MRNITAICLVLFVFCAPLTAHDSPVLVFSDLPRPVSAKIMMGLTKTAGCPVLPPLRLDSGDNNIGVKILSEVSARNPRAVICLGTRPSRVALMHIVALPPVYMLALPRSLDLGRVGSKHGSFCGISLEFSPSQVLKAIHMVCPGKRKVAFLGGNSPDNPFLSAASRESAAEYGIDIIVRSIKNRRSLGRNAVEILRQSQLLYLMPDQLILQHQTAQYLLARALQMGRPVMAPSPNFVRAGALFCLEHDFVELGSQLGDLVSSKTCDNSLYPPRKATLFINRRVARLLGLTIPSALSSSDDVRFLEAK